MERAVADPFEGASAARLRRLSRILYVDESAEARSAFREALAHAFAIRDMAPGALTADLSCDVVVGGGRALGSGGLPELLPHVPRILLVDEDDRGMLTLWMERLTPYLVVRAPWGFEEIRLAVERAVEWSRANPAPLSSKPEGDEAPSARLGLQPRILTTSPSMVRVLQQITAVADADVSVLVTGETGVGKELVARTIHDESPRSQKRFVAQNLAALPPELMTSELFGHVKGAFTGAQKERRGLFELADGGTLFLDEIGEAPQALQALLLRALETREFWPVGASEPRRVNVRVVAATNRDLFAQAQAGQFRLDLFYRLAVTTVHIPPLRDRQDDIRLLGQQFLEQSAIRMGRKLPRVTESAWLSLEEYPWPGNVRELGNVMERLVIYHPGGEVGADLLGLPEMLDTTFPSCNAPRYPDRPSGARAAYTGHVPDAPTSQRWASQATPPGAFRASSIAPPWGGRPPEPPRSGLLPDVLPGQILLDLPAGGTTFDALERQILVQILERAEGNQSRAARALGLSESTFRSRLKRLGLKG